MVSYVKCQRLRKGYPLNCEKIMFKYIKQIERLRKRQLVCINA